VPYYESPALTIDFARLPPPKVIEEIDYEVLLQTYKDQILTKDPTLERALRLEQSAFNIILESEAYGEMIVRSRVNAAVRAVLLAFASGSDLDNLAALYNVERIPLVTTPGNVDAFPDDWETDERFRRRVQLAPEAFSTCGTAGGYIFHALSASPTLRDASAVAVNRRGNVKLTLLNSGADPVPTTDQINAVVKRVTHPNIKPLTDVISVSKPTIFRTPIDADVTLYPGPDSALVMADIRAALERLRTRISLLGRDLTRSAIITSLNQEGVQNVTLRLPEHDIVAGLDQGVLITSANVRVLNGRLE
jgi:phage-related baseplate assembly protein